MTNTQKPHVQWYKVVDAENRDPSFDKVAILNGDVYFAVECFNLNRSEAISVILALNGEGFINPNENNEALSGVYISSNTMNKAFKEKEFSQEEIDGFNQIVKNIKEQCVYAQVLLDMKDKKVNVN